MSPMPSPKTPSAIPASFEESDRRAGRYLAKLSLDEKLLLISGHNSFYIKGFPEHGIPELYSSDATCGVHIRRELSQQLEKSTAFPSPIALAAAWNPELTYRYARSVGEECRAGGIAILLAPGMNIYRVSQCSRNFEYFGEDPLLVSRMIERYVRGVLDTGTMATLKHFLANNTDFYRRTADSILDERTMHEIYLPAFKAGIAAGATAVMTSYNLVNGEWAGQSDFVINQLLRDQLGYRWLVMTDWVSVWDAEKIIRSGQDLEMPGEKCLKADARRLLQEGRVTEAQIDRMARSIIRACVATGLYDRPLKDESFLATFPAHAEVALETAREGVVLLKNDGLLPLRKGAVKKLLVTGKFVGQLPRGGGSSEVDGYDNLTLGAALKDEFGPAVELVEAPTDAQLRSADVVIVSTGTLDHEGWDRPFALPEADEAQVLRAVSLNPRTIVVVNTGAGLRMTGWAGQAAAVVHGWYPGQVGNRAVAEILSGTVNPSGKLPFTLEREFSDSPGAGYLPKGAKYYTGWDNDNDMTQPINRIEYKEGVFVGYRWYEAKKIRPLFAFGHGLSYTKFEYSGLKVAHARAAAGGTLSIRFVLKNAGAVPGAEVAQLYIRQEKPSVPRPEKELKGFAKVRLEAGESRTIELEVKERDLGYWDVAGHGWKTEPGRYRVLVGGASDAIALEAGFDVA